MSTILAIDIGNTSTSLGIVCGQRVKRICRIPRRQNTAKRIRQVLKSTLRGANIDGSAICSVVPALTQEWNKQVKSATSMSPLKVSHKLELGLTISYPKPSQIGPDRLANAAAAIHKYGAPVMVADFGTALTFDVISSDSAYVGGVIAPGLPLMTDYLADRTALLPHIRLQAARNPIGKSTTQAMRIGAKVGYRGMVREITQHLKQALNTRRITMCATGGYARWALKDSNMPFHFEPNLTLHGLGQIYLLNR